jgi:hypothetical protein
MIKTVCVSIIIVVLLIIVVTSTSFINNRLTCDLKHISSKKMLIWEIPGFFKMFNPSITKYGKQYVLCTRYSNKTVKNIFMYAYSELDYQSNICCAILDKYMNIQQVVFPLTNNCNPTEDPRIHYHNDQFFISATEFKNKQEIFPTIFVLDKYLKYVRKIDYNRPNYFTVMPVSNIQKNWCPFSHNNKLVVHTDSYPLWNVFELNSDNGCMEIITSVKTTDFFYTSNHKIVRCSTSWKPFSKSTYICGLHTKQFCTIFPTIRTILVEIDSITLKPIRKTDVICVDSTSDTRIQFLSGLEVDDTYVYLTYGIGDYKSEIHRLTKTYINKLFTTSK